MDELNTTYSSQPVYFKKPWFKRPLFLVFLAVVVMVGYFAFRLGVAYNTIVIDNGERPRVISWLGSITEALFDSKNSENIETDGPNPMPQAEPDRLDILILGIRGITEKEVTEEGGLLTDTILIASFDKITKRAALISIPRDLYIDMFGVKGKINQIYERGLEQRKGLDLAKQIVSRLSGVYIDKAVVFDFNAFEHSVDALGGIDVRLAKPFREATQWGYEFYLPAGLNHLNGEQALYYVRSRFSTSDFDRSRRQQEVITAIKDKAIKAGYLSNPIKVTNLVSQLKGDIRTDFQIWDIKDIIDLTGSFSTKSQIKNYVIDTTNLVYESRSAKGEYILLPKGDNYEEIKNLFKNILIN